MNLVVTGITSRKGTDSDATEPLVVTDTLNSGGNSGGFRTEPVAYQQHGSDVGEMAALRAGHGDVQSGVPFVAATLKQRGRGATDEVMDNLQVVTALRHLGSGGPDDNEAQGGHLIVEGDSAASTPDLPRLRAGTGRGGETAIFAPEMAATLNPSHEGKHTYPGDGGTLNLVAHTLSAEGADASEDGTGRGTPIIPIRYAEQWGRDKRQNGIGLGEDGDPSFTLDGSYAHGVGVASAVRRLTPLECERLQAFPDGWSCLCGATEAMLAELGIAEADWRRSDWRTLRLDGHTARCRCPDGPRYRSLGNAITVTVVEWLARRLSGAS